MKVAAAIQQPGSNVQDQIWLNIDKKLRTQVMYFPESCPDVDRRGVGEFKPVNDAKGRDGWWQSFDSVASAYQDAATRPTFNPIVAAPRALGDLRHSRQWWTKAACSHGLLSSTGSIKEAHSRKNASKGPYGRRSLTPEAGRWPIGS
jgi:hypothetical protein